MRLLRLFQRERRTSPLWLVIYTDMITNLTLLFILLFAMTRMPEEQRQLILEGMTKAVKKEAQQERVERQRREEEAIRVLNDTIVYGKLKQYARMDVDEKKVKLTLELPVFFPSGSADMNKDARDALASLVSPLKDFPNDIVIEGHTDNVPISGGVYPSNWELSIARAVSVMDFFTEKGIDARKLVAGGYGEFHPIAPNDTDQDRAKNRRIEITILRVPKA